MYRAHFKYHPVGQGCFYTGELYAGSAHLFNFVYDCGTNSEQEYVIGAVNGSSVKKRKAKINVCIISHFHRDHISGIPHLLKGKRCDRLVIPYYDPLERLIVYLQSADHQDEDHRTLMQDPYTYFSGEGFDIGEIIVVGGGANNSEQQFTTPVAPGPDKGDSGNEEFRISNNSDGYADDWQNSADNEVFFQQLQRSEPDADLSKVGARQVPYQMRTALYKFIFYCRKMEGGSDVDFQLKIKELRKQIDLYLVTQRRNPKFAGIGFKDLFDAKHIKEIARIYGNVFGPTKLNGTSLAAFHRSVLSPEDYMAIPIYHIRLPLRNPHGKEYGSMMTGDLDLESQEKLVLFQEYYQHYLREVGIFQVMHHGSDANWPFGITQSRLHKFPAYVVNHGAGRAHHPGKEVSKLLHRENPDNVYLNNEFTSLLYGYFFGLR